MLLGLILALVSIGDAPFPMPPIEESAIPAQEFRIDAFGARPDGSNARAAIAAGVKACVAAGGGRVVVPPGRWVTGAIRLASNVALHLEKGSELVFTQDPSDYLPAVRTSWEGVECCNYAPCVSAFGATNVAITGEGTLRGFEGDYTNSLWYAWARPPAGGPQAMASTRRLYDWMSDGVPVERRRLTDFPDPQTRPHLVQFNRCRNVLMDGFTVRESPFWTLHVYKCENVVARHLDVEAHGHNTDGIDIESSRNCLVEDSRFNQGDDGFVIKAGRNRDGWELAGPAENIVIRRCHVERGHTLLGIGSELSGGIRNVALYDCTVGKVYKLFFVKTNPRRGGFVENIHLANVRTDEVRSILSFGTGFYSRWKNFPDREIRLTRVDGLHVSHVDCNACDSVLDLVGDARLPARNVFVSDVVSRVVRGRPQVVENIEGLRLSEPSSSVPAR